MQTVLIRFVVDLTFEKLFSVARCRMRQLLSSRRDIRTLGLRISGLQRFRIVYPQYPGEFAERSTSFSKRNAVRDVLKFPKHSKDAPAFIGSCQLNGHGLPGTAIGVLRNEDGVEILPAVSAWRIDDKQMKFVELKTEGISCSRDGIITADGGL